MEGEEEDERGEKTEGETREITEEDYGSVNFVPTRDNRVFNGPLGHSLRSFARSAPSLATKRFASRCLLHSLASLARSIHRPVHLLCSLPHGTIEIHEYVFTL